MLRRAGCSYRLAPFLGTMTVLATAAAAHAQATFDGLWSVQIVSQAGPCGQGYVTYPVRIARGTVQNAGNQSAFVAGRGGRRGGGRGSLSSGGHQTPGGGRLSPSGGAGPGGGPAHRRSRVRGPRG